MSQGFTCKQFHIKTSGCGMPVSTDGILLGAWANIEEADNILDIGCGAGLLSIMCAQRNKQGLITGIDIEKNAIQAALMNAQSSPWSQRIEIKHCSLQTFVNNNQLGNTGEADYFAAVICNPPYFNSGEQSQNTQRALARHATSLSHRTLLAGCYEILRVNGTASFILPVTEGRALIESLESINVQSNKILSVSRQTLVHTKQNKPATRLLIEITKHEANVNIATQTSRLNIHDKAGYSDDFIHLTNAFYLKM